MPLNPFARRSSTGSNKDSANEGSSAMSGFDLDLVIKKFKTVEDGLGVWGTPETGDDINVTEFAEAMRALQPMTKALGSMFGM